MSIDVDVTDGIATITINRPERMNAMDAEHYKGLSQAWMRGGDDAAICVAVITRAGGKALNAHPPPRPRRIGEHTAGLHAPCKLPCRLLLGKKKRIFNY